MKKNLTTLISIVALSAAMLTSYSPHVTETPVKGRLLPPVPFSFTDHNNIAVLNWVEHEVNRPFSRYSDEITIPYDGTFDKDGEIAYYARRYEGETLSILGHSYPEMEEKVVDIEDGNFVVRMFLNGGYSYLVLNSSSDYMITIKGIIDINDFEALTTY